MAQDREGRVRGPAEVWGLARAETKAPVAVAADKANGPNRVAAAARAVVVARDRAAPDVEVTGKTDLGYSEKGAASCQVEMELDRRALGK